MLHQAATDAKALVDKEAELATLTADLDIRTQERDGAMRAARRQFDALTAERQKVRELERAAVSLAKEVKGQLGLEGPSIREAIGNTNYRCLSDKASAVLGLTGDATEGQG